MSSILINALLLVGVGQVVQPPATTPPTIGVRTETLSVPVAQARAPVEPRHRFDAPVEQFDLPAGPIPLAPGSIVATGRTLVPARVLVLGEPLQTAGTITAGASSESRWAMLYDGTGDEVCLVHSGPFTPFRDQAGVIYPTLCLIRPDAAGAYRAARFIPYDLAAGAVIEEPIAPVHLQPAQPLRPADARPGLDGMVISTEARVLTASSDKAVVQLSERADWGSGPEPTRRDGNSVSVHLRAGARTRLDGLELRVSGAPGAWAIAASGAFGPAAVVSKDGLEVHQPSDLSGRDHS